MMWGTEGCHIHGDQRQKSGLLSIIVGNGKLEFNGHRVSFGEKLRRWAVTSLSNNVTVPNAWMIHLKMIEMTVGMFCVFFFQHNSEQTKIEGTLKNSSRQDRYLNDYIFTDVCVLLEIQPKSLCMQASYTLSLNTMLQKDKD